jgi:hypothetical protein
MFCKHKWETIDTQTLEVKRASYFNDFGSFKTLTFQGYSADDIVKLTEAQNKMEIIGIKKLITQKCSKCGKEKLIKDEIRM